MSDGFNFEVKLVDQLGRPVRQGKLTLTQGRFTGFYQGKPSGLELNGGSYGLKVLVDVPVNPQNGVATIKGWPPGVPAWIQITSDVYGGSWIPDFPYTVAEPVKGFPILYLFEFVPLKGRKYNFYLHAKGLNRLQVSGEVFGFLKGDERRIHVFLEYGKGLTVYFKPEWNKGKFKASLMLSLNKPQDRHKGGNLRLKEYFINIGFPFKKKLRFGPFSFESDSVIKGIQVSRELLYSQKNQ